MAKHVDQGKIIHTLNKKMAQKVDMCPVIKKKMAVLKLYSKMIKVRDAK